MTSRLWLPVAVLLGLLAGNASAWDFTVSLDGNTIVVNVYGMDNTGGHQTCMGASADDPWGGAHCGIPGSTYDSDTITCNRVGPHVVYVDVSDASTNGYETRSTTVTVTEPPPVYCAQFALYTKGSIALTHKYGAEDYPGGQTADHQMEVYFKPVRVDAGTPIYMKVVDAEDPSSYRTSAPATNDNLDSGAGKLALSPSDTGNQKFTLTVGTDPLTKLYLNTTDWAGGDNYIIQSSANPDLHNDPNFVCNAANACQQTWPITSWKRVYLEKQEMFRRGVWVAGTALAGSNQVLVQVPTGLRWSRVALRPGDPIRLLHAPRFDGFDMSSGFHYEDATVADVAQVSGYRNRRLLTLASPLQYSYNEDTTYATALEDGITDGVGDVAAGVYGRNEAYMHSSFSPAFVELRPIPQSVTEIPYHPVVRRMYSLANKWFENTTVTSATRARPGNWNVKHVLTGSGHPDTTTNKLVVTPYTYGDTGLELSVLPPAGVSDYLPRPNFSWTWAGSIERAVSMHGNPFEGLDAWVFNGENLVHELAHTFNVNSVYYYGGDFGHCGRLAAGSTRNCKMRSSSDPLHVPADSGDGFIGFHYSDEHDSEYMTMRRATEPLAIPIK